MTQLKFDLPRDTYTPIKIAGHLTVKDILRLSLPTGILTGLLYSPEQPVTSLTAVVAGLALGLSWIFIKVEGRPVDTHLYHLLRQQVEPVDSVEVDQVLGDTGITRDGAAIGVVKVQPVSLTMQDQDEQTALHSILSELYETISFPIEIHSRQIPLHLDSYINSLEKQPTGQGSGLEDDYISFSEEFNDSTQSTTHHYVVVRTRQPETSKIQDTVHQLREEYPGLDRYLEYVDPYLPFDLGRQPSNEPLLGELEHRLQLVTDTLTRGPLEAERLTGVELQQYILSFEQDTDIETGSTSYRIPGIGIGEYRKPLYINEFPSSAHLGWTVDLLNHSNTGRIDLIQRIEPKNQSKAVRTLERNIERLDAELTSRVGGGLIKDITELEAKRDDAEQMLELCADNSQTLVDYSAYVIAHGNTPQERDQAYTDAETRLDTLLADTRKPLYRTGKAYQSESVLHGDGLYEPTLMPSSSAAAGFPFATSNRNEGAGVIYGTSTEDSSPVLLDQWRWSSYSTAILGKTGSGKSYFAKTLLLRWYLAYTDTRFVIVDPKNEYGSLIDQLNGTTIQAQNGLNGFEDRLTVVQVEERGHTENTDRLTQLVQDLYTATSQTRERTIVVIDEAHNILREKEGRKALERFVREARDTQTAVVMISQNAADFTSNIEGRNTLKNTEAVFLMRHSDVADDVTDFFQLSQTEKAELQKLKTGTQGSYSEALMKISDRLNTKIRVEATDTEHQLIEQKAEKKGGQK